MKLGHLLLPRKAMKNLDSILKSKDINLPTKVHIVKAVVFPVVDDITGSTDMSLSKLQVTAKDREAWCTAVHGLQRVRHDLATEQQSCQRLDFRLQPAL